MKLSAKALLKVAGIRCRNHEVDPETGEEIALPARLAFVSETTAAAARNLSSRDREYTVTEGDPDVTYGSVLAVSRSANGPSVAKLLKPGEESGFKLEIDGEMLALTGSGMLPLREKMIAMTRAGRALEEGHRHALSGIQEIFEMVSCAPDTDRFPARLIAQAYHASMIDSFGEVELGISDEEFARKSRADLCRARIGQLAPAHVDAMDSSRPLRDLLANAGVEINAAGMGAEIRGAAARQITEEKIRRMILANDRMCREVFGALTLTPIEQLSAAVIAEADHARLLAQKGNRRLTGPWVDRAEQVTRDITRSGMPGYQFDFSLFAEDGRDYLMVADNVSRKNGVAFVYSWPTAMRRPVMEVEAGRMIAVSPADVPDEAEMERLERVLSQLEADPEVTDDDRQQLLQ